MSECRIIKSLRLEEFDQASSALSPNLLSYSSKHGKVIATQYPFSSFEKLFVKV